MIGILLLNIGTPDNYDVNSVRKYLNQFLDDDNIIKMNRILRYILVNFIICPIRSVPVAKKYKSVWHKEGSPLLVYSKKLKEKMSLHYDNKVLIELGMIVGNPSIKSSIHRLIKKGCTKLVILPMFPQYSTVTTGSCISKTLDVLKEYNNMPSDIVIIKDFFSNKNFIKSVCHNVKKELKNYDEYDFLFSLI